MVPFEAMEAMGRERRQALRAEADSHRLTSGARARARRRVVGRMSGWWLALRSARPSDDRRVRSGDRPVLEPAQRTT